MATHGHVLVLIAAILSLMIFCPAVVTAMACPLYCLDVDYITCNSSPGTKFAAACNCCLFTSGNPGENGCQLHLSDGTTMNC
ncbi:hypothetical protein KP509_02G083100 [Ceratopteris richardii]|uniref:Uncharacterized protein n=1 Tax=Ceratopteris richardii TaxID=49495 RepID=A0A8T2VBI5_CERRI|nr:hypothetical protein KP509_02G083100 [Ceratopteris richardii]